MAGNDHSNAPSFENLPEKKSRAFRGGAERTSVSVEIEVSTTSLGGGYRAGKFDDVDIIRPTTVKGHLRFWWRALYGHSFHGKDLFRRESELWGQAAEDGKGRSSVDLRIEVLYASGEDTANRPEDAYALWSARGIEEARREPGTRFRLTIMGPHSRREELTDVIRAWILFGGYGSRTRRGAGSMTALSDPTHWLPDEATRPAFESFFKRDIFSGEHPLTNTPVLAGALLQVGGAVLDARVAWATALGWLSEFRQGTKSGARQSSSDPRRPSISNWPEADKVRQLLTPRSGKWAHAPRHNSDPAWPRAGFGLPIPMQFQQNSRESEYDPERNRNVPVPWDKLPEAHPNSGGEPGKLEIRWRPSAAGGSAGDRLASPLIVKALPISGRRYAPCALWLSRAYPSGDIVLREILGGGRSREVRGSAAPFDRILGPALCGAGEIPFYTALSEATLRDSFMGWLNRERGTCVISP